MSRGIAKVDIALQNNASWADGFQFGDPADFTWSFSGCKFFLDAKINQTDTTPVMSLSSDAGTIVISDVVNRILVTSLPYLVLQAAIVANPQSFSNPDQAAEWWYDLVMETTATGQRDILMYGQIRIYTGVTFEG